LTSRSRSGRLDPLWTARRDDNFNFRPATAREPRWRFGALSRASSRAPSQASQHPGLPSSRLGDVRPTPTPDPPLTCNEYLSAMAEAVQYSPLQCSANPENVEHSPIVYKRNFPRPVTARPPGRAIPPFPPNSGPLMDSSRVYEVPKPGYRKWGLGGVPAVWQLAGSRDEYSQAHMANSFINSKMH